MKELVVVTRGNYHPGKEPTIKSKSQAQVDRNMVDRLNASAEIEVRSRFTAGKTESSTFPVETRAARFHPRRQGPYANGDYESQKEQKRNGFSVLETVIVVMFIGLVAAILIPKFSGVAQAASTVRCAANLLSFADEISYLSLEGPSPTQAQVEATDIGWPNGKRKDYWYIPNNADSNSGHGNDLDGCDEENPGESLPNRECVPMKFLIVCKHTSHGDQGDAKYLFITDMYPPMIVPFEEHRHTYLLDAKWWPKEDPGWDQWIGWTPKK